MMRFDVTLFTHPSIPSHANSLLHFLLSFFADLRLDRLKNRKDSKVFADKVRTWIMFTTWHVLPTVRVTRIVTAHPGAELCVDGNTPTRYLQGRHFSFCVPPLYGRKSALAYLARYTARVYIVFRFFPLIIIIFFSDGFSPFSGYKWSPFFFVAFLFLSL